MKKILLLFSIFSGALVFSQNPSSPSHQFSANYFYGAIIEHNYEIGHLITQRPSGVLLSWNRKTYGEKIWSRHYNYPDYGWSFTYQDMGNPHLGESIGLYGHLNFYFFQRHFKLKIAEGLVYNTNPYDPVHNYRNYAYGSHFMFATLLMGNYIEQDIINGFGLQAGILLIHYSNGNIKSPNASTNSISVNLGVVYTPDHHTVHHYLPKQTSKNYAEPVHFNFALRTGIDSGPLIGMGQYPFLTLAAFADKRLTYSSGLQLGAEVFFSKMLEEYIRYQAIAYPELQLTGEESSTRVGVFAGYQFYINKFSIFANTGYYVFYPVEFNGRVYNRVGLRRDILHHFFVSLSVRAHGFNAEDAALSIGIRL